MKLGLIPLTLDRMPKVEASRETSKYELFEYVPFDIYVEQLVSAKKLYGRKRANIIEQPLEKFHVK